MRQVFRGWPFVLLSVGAIAIAAFIVVDPHGSFEPVWYLPIAALGTGMAIAGSRRRPRSQRRIWVAIAVGQSLYLLGDVVWYFYADVLKSVPYPSIADFAYLLRYGAVVIGLCWLVRGRRPGRDRAAFLDAAIVSSAFALLATVFLIVPAARGGDVSLLSNVVAAAYPVGDVLVLAVVIQLVATRAARNIAFISLTGGFLALLGVDVVYTEIVAAGATLPGWSSAGYLATYLLIGFAAMHPSSRGLAEASPTSNRPPTTAKIAMLGFAMLLGPCLLAALYLSGSELQPVTIAVCSSVSTVLVLTRLFDLLRIGEAQSLQLSALARTDSLTGVANRRSWDHELARAVAVAEVDGSPLTIALMDLDNFKGYNDTHGHLAGDRVLNETATAWGRLLASRGFIARYGGEEFAVLIPHTSPAVAEPLLHQLRQSVASGQTCSMGVTQWQHGEEPHRATARADQALYAAKRAGRNQVATQDRTGARLLHPAEPRVVDRNITSVFQPIVDLQTGATMGYEALSRFADASPMEVFAEARLRGMTQTLEIAAIKAALRAHHAPGWLSLNVSLSTLLLPELDEVLPHDLSSIVLEITEYENHADTTGAAARLAALRARGARIGIDDLGTGFSNLNRLLWLEPELVKLDLSLVRDVNNKPGHLAMIRALGAYAEAIGAQLCAEGIETADEWHALADAGVALGQGYLFGRPAPAVSIPAIQHHPAA